VIIVLQLVWFHFPQASAHKELGNPKLMCIAFSLFVGIKRESFVTQNQTSYKSYVDFILLCYSR